MPCQNLKLTTQQTQTRDRELRNLERQIEAGTVTVKSSGDGAEFVGWKTDRENPGHWHDDCAYRTLMAEGSTALRMALARQQPSRMERRTTA